MHFLHPCLAKQGLEVSSWAMLPGGQVVVHVGQFAHWQTLTQESFGLGTPYWFNGHVKPVQLMYTDAHAMQPVWQPNFCIGQDPYGHVVTHPVHAAGGGGARVAGGGGDRGDGGGGAVHFLHFMVA